MKQQAKDRLSSWRTGRLPASDHEELSEVVDKLVTAESEVARLRHTLEHVIADRDRLLQQLVEQRFDAADRVNEERARLLAAEAELLANGLRG